MKRVMCLFVVLASTLVVLADEAKVKVVKVDGDSLTVAVGAREVKLDAKDAKIFVGDKEVPAEAKARVLKEGAEITITFDKEKKTISKILVVRPKQ